MIDVWLVLRTGRRTRDR